MAKKKLNKVTDNNDLNQFENKNQNVNLKSY